MIRSPAAWIVAAGLVAGACSPDAWAARPRRARVSAPAKAKAKAAAPKAREAGAVVTGEVRGPDGRPVAGALVIWRSRSTTESLTFYTGVDGKFRGRLDWSGAADLRVRADGLADGFFSAHPLDGRKIRVDLKPYPDVPSALLALPASAHAAGIPWGASDGPMREEFIGQCQFCHQIGNAWTRAPRDRRHWETVIDRMEGMGALLTSEARGRFPSVLAKPWLAPSPARAAADSDRNVAALSRARVREWALADPLSFLHDLEAGPDGVIYAPDMSFDRMYALDTRTGAVTVRDLPSSGLQPGGMFAAAIHPVGTFGARFGPHSVVRGPDGLLWLTASLGGALLRYDPRSGLLQEFPVPEGVYPHTLRFDRSGRIWFTLAVSNQVAVFDPRAVRFRFASLPAASFLGKATSRISRFYLSVMARFFPATDAHVLLSPHRLTGEGSKVLDLPYGIDISPVDGSVWYSKLHAGVIGRIDPVTLAVREIRLPKGVEGPRRLRFDPRSGALWIPAFTSGKLLRFDPATGAFETIALPVARGEREAPYALNVDPSNGDVWITAGQSDRLLRYEPGARRFTGYPLPTRVTFMRDIVFRDAASGSGREICTVYSNLPAHAIEGGRPKIACLDPG